MWPSDFYTLVTNPCTAADLGGGLEFVSWLPWASVFTK